MADEHELMRGDLAVTNNQRDVEELPRLARGAQRGAPAACGRCHRHERGRIGSATGGALAPPAPRVVRRLAGLSAGAAEAELERRLRVELEAAAALRVDMVGWAARRNSLVVASSRA